MKIADAGSFRLALTDFSTAAISARDNGLAETVPQNTHAISGRDISETDTFLDMRAPPQTGSRGDFPGESRVLESLRKHKALPPLGKALDMRDSHPAKNVLTGACDVGDSTPHRRDSPPACPSLQRREEKAIKAPSRTGSPMRRCLAEPIPEIFMAAEKLNAAVDAHSKGQSEEAHRLLVEADDPTIWKYTDSVWGKGARKRFGFLTLPDAPPILARDERPRPRMPNPATRAAIIARDGFHCRFCGIPVISSAKRSEIQKAYPLAVKWGAANIDQHAAFQCMWLQFDHILPNGRGGDSSLGNMVITCAPCNFGRMETTLEEAQLIDPRGQSNLNAWSGATTWDGLERFYRSI